MAIKANKVASIRDLKKSLKKGGAAGGAYLRRHRKDEDSIIVRFLTEPDKWVTYIEHYSKNHEPNYFPCDDEDCFGCDEIEDGVTTDKPSTKYLANVVEVAEGKVVPMVLTKTLAGDVLKAFEKYGTVLDRDYDLMREGSGRDGTSYKALPEAPTKMRLDRFDKIDLVALLEAQAAGSDDDDDDDEEEEVKVRKPISKKAKIAAKKNPSSAKVVIKKKKR